MPQTLAIADTVTTLAEAESRFKLQPAQEPQFFREWVDNLPALSEVEQARLNLIKQRYWYHRKYGHLAEGTVNFIIIAPLLELAGFYDPPYLLRSEVTVKLEIEARDETLKGRIDSLVLLEQFWVLLVESKQTTFSVDVAIPQALAYMMNCPHSNKPAFGLVSNGGYFMFLKLMRQDNSKYALSDDFSLYRQHNELFAVLQVLKRIGAEIR